MFEVVGNLDEALRLVTESRSALNSSDGTLFIRVYASFAGVTSNADYYTVLEAGCGHIKKLEQLRLCETILRRKALSRTVRHLHYFGYLRLRSQVLNFSEEFTPQSTMYSAKVVERDTNYP